jgi:uncharacterized Rmd1/YagE family protein
VYRVGSEDQVIHATNAKMDVCIFHFGCVVFFNCSQEEETGWFAHLEQLTKGDSLYDEADVDVDDMHFFYGACSEIGQHEFTLESTDHMEKMAIAYAFAQSGRLSIYELRVAREIERTNHIPQEMARTGTVRLTCKELARMIGGLHIQRSDVNLTSDILDMLPEALWDEDQYESVYANTRKYLDMEERVETLNQRLDIMRELLEILHNQAVNQHANRLEWIIIILVAGELVASILALIDWEGLWDTHGRH